MVSSGSGDGGILSESNFSTGWVDVWVVSEPVFDSSFSFSSIDLVISVGVNLIEDLVGLFHGDAKISSFSGDFDGGGGGDEGEEGEFHFERLVFLFVIIVLITLA